MHFKENQKIHVSTDASPIGGHAIVVRETEKEIVIKVTDLCYFNHEPYDQKEFEKEMTLEFDLEETESIGGVRCYGSLLNSQSHAELIYLSAE